MLQSYVVNYATSTPEVSPHTHNLVTAKSGGGLELREWSSFIGIVTAIIGNILISFALNVQRYAHIRIQQEYDEGRLWKRGKRRAGGLRNYGTQQQTLIAEEEPYINVTATARENGSPTNNGQKNGHIGRDETEPEPMKRSFLSDHTVASSERSSENGDRKSYLSSPYWWLGIVLMTVGETGNFLAYGFAPASIVSPLGVVALISNCVIAPFMLKEKFRQRDLWGVLVAVAGAVTVVLSAKTSEEKLGPHDIWDAITRWEFETYLGITAALIIGLMWASGKYGDRSILIDLGLVGLFGGYTALSTKGIASLLSDTLWRTLTFPITYLLLAILFGTAGMQIRYINRALQRFDSTQVIPTQFVLFTLSVIIGSIVLYRDFESRTAEQVVKFAGGCFLTFLGVYLITSGRPRGKDDIDEDEEEAAIHLMNGEYQDEAVEELATESGRRGRDLTLSTSFDGKGVSSTSPRRESLPIDNDQSPTPRRLHTPSPTRRPSVAFEDLPPREEDRDSLGSNPWESSQERLSAVDALSRINTTQSTPKSFHPASMSTSIIPQLDTPIQHHWSSRPSSPPKTDPRPSLSGLSRRSMSRILPGPLISPLSSSLSAVVADSLRKGVGVIDGTPSRRRLSRLGGALKRARTTMGTQSNTREDHEPDRFLRSAEPQGGEPEEGAEERGERKKRMRSFSDALGWLSRDENRKKRRDGEDEGGEGPRAGNRLTGTSTPDPMQSRETIG